MLEPNVGVKKSQRYRTQKKELTDKEKLEIFEALTIFHQECSAEISSALYKRRERKRKAAYRLKHGINPKKKTTKAEYELKMLHSIPSEA